MLVLQIGIGISVCMYALPCLQAGTVAVLTCCYNKVLASPGILIFIHLYKLTCLILIFNICYQKNHAKHLVRFFIKQPIYTGLEDSGILWSDLIFALVF